MTLEMLMAFTRQPRSCPAGNRSGSRSSIPITANPGTFASSSPKLPFPPPTSGRSSSMSKFYQAAGGEILHPICSRPMTVAGFRAALLDRLVSDKLKANADEIAAKAGSGSASIPTCLYGHDHGLRALTGTPSISPTTSAPLARRCCRNTTGSRRNIPEADELPDGSTSAWTKSKLRSKHSGNARLSTIQLRSCAPACSSTSIAKASLSFVVAMSGRRTGPIDAEGHEVDGVTDPADAENNGSVQRAIITIGGQSAEPEEDDEEDVIKPLPERLVTELTAHRTLALRDAVGSNPQVALTALLHNWCATPSSAPARPARVCRRRSITSSSANRARILATSHAKSIAQRHEGLDGGSACGRGCVVGIGAARRCQSPGAARPLRQLWRQRAL